MTRRAAREVVLRALPHGLVQDMRDRRLLLRLGAATSRPRAARMVREARLDLLPPQALRGIDTVVDVGANEGAWSAAVVAVARPRRLIAIEPSPAVLPRLRAALGSVAGVSIVEAAAGESVGDVTLQLTAHDHNTSLLQPRSTAMDELYGEGYAVIEQITVAMATLDGITSDLNEISLLKIDAQGYERAVLLGAQSALQKTRWLLIEANFQSHYEGDTLFPELHAYLVERGFLLTGMAPPFVRGGIALWSDALYTRS